MKLTPAQLETLSATMSEMVSRLPFEAVFIIATPHDVIISTPTSIANNRNKARDTYINATTTLAKNLIDDVRHSKYKENIREFNQDEDEDKPSWQK
jgi:hypothetical protein